MYEAGLRQLEDLRVEAALVASGLVLVYQATRGVAVHDRLGGSEGFHGGGLVLHLDGLDDLLQGGAHHGTGADVAQAALLGLARALLRGLDVGQERTPGKGLGWKKTGNYAVNELLRQPLSGLPASHHAATRLLPWRPGRLSH